MVAGDSSNIQVSDDNKQVSGDNMQELGVK